MKDGNFGQKLGNIFFSSFKAGPDFRSQNMMIPTFSSRICEVNFTGESGSGKTEASKHIMRYIAKVSLSLVLNSLLNKKREKNRGNQAHHEVYRQGESDAFSRYSI